VVLGLLFGIGLGIAFGVYEDGFKDYIAEGIAANPQLHDAKSSAKIWRYVQRAHFHATGIAAFSLGLLILTALSDLKDRLKGPTSILIGLSSFYAMGWFNMFLLAPEIGRDAAHGAFMTELYTYVGVGGLLAGMGILLGNVFLGLFRAPEEG